MDHQHLRAAALFFFRGTFRQILLPILQTVILLCVAFLLISYAAPTQAADTSALVAGCSGQEGLPATCSNYQGCGAAKAGGGPCVDNSRVVGTTLSKAARQCPANNVIDGMLTWERPNCVLQCPSGKNPDASGQCQEQCPAGGGQSSGFYALNPPTTACSPGGCVQSFSGTQPVPCPSGTGTCAQGSYANVGGQTCTPGTDPTPTPYFPPENPDPDDPEDPDNPSNPDDPKDPENPDDPGSGEGEGEGDGQDGTEPDENGNCPPGTTSYTSDGVKKCGPGDGEQEEEPCEGPDCEEKKREQRGECDDFTCSGDAIDCAIAKSSWEVICLERKKEYTQAPDCDAEPECEGDVIQCGIAATAWKQRCQMAWAEDENNEFKKEWDKAKGEFDEGSVEFVKEKDDSWFKLGNHINGPSGGCPSTISFSFFTETVQIPFDWFCNALAVISFLVQAMAWVFVGRLVLEAF